MLSSSADPHAIPCQIECVAQHETPFGLVARVYDEHLHVRSPSNIGANETPGYEQTTVAFLADSS